MKISFNWIKDLIDEELDLENCIDLLTDIGLEVEGVSNYCLLYTSPSPRDRQKSRMPSSA